jgi:hypothetical protein
MEITMCCLVDEDLAWCLLQSVHRKSSHSGHQVSANLDSERDLNSIDAAFEKIKSDITNNISEIDQQKRNFLSDISDMRKFIAMFGAFVLYR